MRENRTLFLPTLLYQQLFRYKEVDWLTILHLGFSIYSNYPKLVWLLTIFRLWNTANSLTI